MSSSTLDKPSMHCAPNDNGHDYDRVRRAIIFLSESWTEQPPLDDLARHIGLSLAHCQKLFQRWCGLSPTDFMMALTVDHARGLLAKSSSVFATAHKVELSEGKRRQDLFVDHETMTPDNYKQRGDGLTIAYGFHPSPFGETLLLATEGGIAGIAFVNDDAGETHAETLADMTRRWPRAHYVNAPERTAPLADSVFDPTTWSANHPIRLMLIGTAFEVRVWQALLRIPIGRAVSYSDIAHHLGNPKAMRAVGTAVGRNPISFVVPCHRVLRTDGALGGYHWGLTRKRAMLGWEAGYVKHV